MGLTNQAVGKARRGEATVSGVVAQASGLLRGVDGDAPYRRPIVPLTEKGVPPL